MPSLIRETYSRQFHTRNVLWILLLVTNIFVMQAANNPPTPELQTDSVAGSYHTGYYQEKDTIHVESLPEDSIVKKEVKNKSALEDEVYYQANDSIVMLGSGNVYLYGKAKVRYQNITLTSDFIRINMDSSLVYATGLPDSIGEMQGNPVFTEGGDSYSSKAMSYNFETKKGFIWDVVATQGEGYITSENTKKVDDDIFCLRGGRYTTCDHHDHPHFYLKLTKAKMKTNKYVVSGPAYLVFEDVPLPIAIPFGYFPFTKSYSSGLIMPTLGLENERGFYLRGLGYYFAINDYIDLALTGDIYTKGSWGLNAASRYVWRYKFSGSISVNYMENRYGEKGLPNYRKSRDFKITWSHSQNQLSSPYTVFSAGVNFSTSSFERNSLDSYYNPDLLSQNTKGSSISLTQSFPKVPITISLGANLYQRTSDSTISLSLPNLTMSVARIYPFKFKNKVGSKERWYERFGFNYTLRFENSVEVKENMLFKSPYKETWNYAFDHNIPVSFPITFLKYFTITPSFTYRERWYFKGENRSWNEEQNRLEMDTVYRFKRVFDFNTSVSLSTKFYAFYKPLKAIFGDKIEMIRHVITPSVSFSYQPDFGKEKWGYWDYYEREASDGTMVKQYYSPYQSAKYGVPSRGAMGSITMRLENNIEMKVKTRSDTTSQTKKVSIIDNYTVSTSYNAFADSLRWSNINMSLRLKLYKELGLNVQATFDPYTYSLNEFGNPRRVNISQYSKNKVVARLTSISTSFGYEISNATFKSKKEKEETKTKKKYQSKNASLQYAPFSMPWRLRLNYSLRYGNIGEFDKEKMEYKRALIHDLRLDGSISFTPKWSFNFSMSYDITNNNITYMNCSVSRDLHCWSMSIGFVPIGLYRSYNFYIGVKAAMLRDLKLERRNDRADNYIW